MDLIPNLEQELNAALHTQHFTAFKGPGAMGEILLPPLEGEGEAVAEDREGGSELC